MKQNKNQKNTAVNQITEGVIWKVLLTFAVPIILTKRHTRLKTKPPMPF